MKIKFVLFFTLITITACNQNHVPCHIEVGAIELQHFTLYQVNENTFHVTTNVTSNSDVLLILGVLDLQIKGGQRYSLLKHQTIDPGRSFTVYRRNLSISPGDIFQITCILDGEAVSGKDLKMKNFISDISAEAIEEKLGTEDHAKHLGEKRYTH